MNSFFAKFFQLSLGQQIFVAMMAYLYITSWTWIQLVTFRALMITLYYSEIFPHVFWEWT